MVGYDSSLENSYTYDPAKAEATLQAGGWTKVNGTYQKDGKPLSINITAISSVPEYPLIAQAIQGYLRAVGMDAQVTQLATPAWFSANIQGNMSLTPLQYIAVDPDALHLWFLPGQYFNWSHFTDPTLTALPGPAGVRSGKAAVHLRPGSKDHHGPGRPDAHPRERRPGDDLEEPDRPAVLGRRVRVLRRGLDDEVVRSAITRTDLRNGAQS
jgi:extracellular solute-binding protein (family 5)